MLFHICVFSNYACNATDLKISQCIREDKHLDGKLDCRNRADENIFQTHFENSSSLLLDLENILIPCNDAKKPGFRDHKGFKCSDVNRSFKNNNCISLDDWCNPYEDVLTCDELKGKSATGKTNDPQVCRNQTFWEQRICNFENRYRCTGETPGQCAVDWRGQNCLDGSSEIKPAEGGDCGGELMCTARGGRWFGLKVCIKDQFTCDEVIHCRGEEDETNCSQQLINSTTLNTMIRCWGRRCEKFYKPPASQHCENRRDLMCTARHGRYAGRSICLKENYKCDNYLQCEDGTDEEECEKHYEEKRVFPKDHHFVCRRPFLTVKTKDNKTGRFFPKRAVR